MHRKSIEVHGLSHNSAPIPIASRIGRVLATSGVGGRDAETGQMPEDIGAQAANCFRNLDKVLEAGGFGMGDVVKVTVYLANEAYRSTLNAPWLDHFPNPECRPVRHTLVLPLRGGMLVQLEALAVASPASD